MGLRMQSSGFVSLARRGDDGRVRLFVALVPPQQAVAELAAATAGLRSDVPELRWVYPEQWHLTLAFFAEVGERTCAELLERLGRAARRHPPLVLSLAGAGRFGERVVWVRVDGDRARLRRLVDSARAAGRRCGLPTEERPYRPHITLARSGPSEPGLGPVVDRLRGFAGSAWPASELHLVRSRLGAGPGGSPRYEIVGSWPLTGGGQDVDAKR